MPSPLHLPGYERRHLRLVSPLPSPDQPIQSRSPQFNRFLGMLPLYRIIPEELAHGDQERLVPDFHDFVYRLAAEKESSSGRDDGLHLIAPHRVRDEIDPYFRIVDVVAPLPRTVIDMQRQGEHAATEALELYPEIKIAHQLSGDLRREGPTIAYEAMHDLVIIYGRTLITATESGQQVNYV